MSKGYFIVFEGGEGAGKTTQLDLLAEWVESQHLPVFLTRQPGGTELGKHLRQLVLDVNKQVSPRAELMLYLADRAQHVDETIKPALDRGTVVISDRYADSSTVYQGLCRKLGMEWVEQLNDFATDRLNPDLVILLDIPVAVATERMKNRGALDRIEKEGAKFHETVRKGFLKIARRFSRRYLVIDATASTETIAEEIQKDVKKRLQRKGLLEK